MEWAQQTTVSQLFSLLTNSPSLDGCGTSDISMQPADMLPAVAVNTNKNK